MDMFNIVEEISLTLARCNKNRCSSCQYEDACIEVFGKEFPSQIIVELAAQCGAFNAFARANEKGNK